MNPKEFRIGNLVLNDKCLNIIETLPSDVVCTLRTKQGNLIQARYELIEGVPLTGEMFVNCGAKPLQYTNKGYWISLYSLKAEIHFEFYGSEIVTTIKSDHCELILDRIRYVHQLQNLIFCLTAEELIFSR
jgi:hypothetical protein